MKMGIQIQELYINPVLNQALNERRKKILTSKAFRRWTKHIKNELKKATYERKIC